MDHPVPGSARQGATLKKIAAQRRGLVMLLVAAGVAWALVLLGLAGQHRHATWIGGVGAVLMLGLLVYGGWRLDRLLHNAAVGIAARRERDVQYRTLAENLPDPLVRVDREGRHIYANPRAEAATGQRPNTLIGKTVAELGMPADNVAAWNTLLQRVLASGRAERQEFRFPGPSGPQDWESIVVPEPGPDGRPNTVLVISRDITARLRVEQALQRSEQRFRLAASFGQVWDWNIETGAVELPATFWADLGHAVPQPPYKLEMLEAVLHPEDRTLLRKALAAHLSRREPYALEFRAVDSTGCERWFQTQGQAVWNESGRATYMAGTSFEITRRKQAEEALRQLNAKLEHLVHERTAELARSEARYRSIFDAVPAAIGEEDWSQVQLMLRELRAAGVTDGPAYFVAHPGFVQDCLRAVRLLSMNRTMLELHAGRGVAGDLPTLEALYGDVDNLPSFVEELGALWAGRRIYRAKKSLPSRTGRPLSLMLTLSLPPPEGGDGRTLCSIVDISEIDRLNAELDTSMGRLKNVNRELETFTYSVSHDLKAPLRGIDGYSRLLLRDHEARLDDEGRSFLANIRQATQHMGLLIDDLLAYSRLERRSLELGPLDLPALVQGVLATCAEELKLRNARVKVELASGLSAWGDAQGLTMALRNLLENALKFTRDAHPPILAISATGSGGAVVLHLQDNGMGFDMKFHDRIFDIFQRLHRAEDFPGTGVGLAIVRKAMERMGGRAWANSEPGQGATFHLQLPESPTS